MCLSVERLAYVESLRLDEFPPGTNHFVVAKPFGPASFQQLVAVCIKPAEDLSDFELPAVRFNACHKPSLDPFELSVNPYFAERVLTTMLNPRKIEGMDREELIKSALAATVRELRTSKRWPDGSVRATQTQKHLESLASDVLSENEVSRVERALTSPSFVRIFRMVESMGYTFVDFARHLETVLAEMNADDPVYRELSPQIAELLRTESGQRLVRKFLDEED